MTETSDEVPKWHKHMKFTLSAESLHCVRWWIDTSHNSHEDCCGHNGSMMSLGRGAVLSYSRKQKINTKSSTETELVGTADELGMVLWTKYFMAEQGYVLRKNVVGQDNKSTILLAENGRQSSSKRTKHIKAKYFFIKDKIKNGDMSLTYCPADRMWADVLNKPKQGRLFREFRSHLMDVDLDYDDVRERLATPEVL